MSKLKFIRRVLLNSQLHRRVVSLFCVAVFSMTNVMADDIDVILTKNRQRIECYILQETDDVVIYMMTDTNDSRKYQLPKSEILNVYYGQRTEQPTQTAQESTPQPTISNAPVHATEKQDVSTKPNNEEKYRIYRDNNEYMYNNTYISSKEVAKILERQDVVAYQQWKKADGLLLGGSICAGVGLGCVTGGLAGLAGGNTTFTIVCCSVGGVACVVGLGCCLGSISKYSKAIDIYNRNAGYAGTLHLHAAPNGIGFAYNF